MLVTFIYGCSETDVEQINDGGDVLYLNHDQQGLFAEPQPEVG